MLSPFLKLILIISGLPQIASHPLELKGYVLQDINRAQLPPHTPWHNQTVLAFWVDSSGRRQGFYPNLDPVTLRRKLTLATPTQPFTLGLEESGATKTIQTCEPLAIQNVVPIPHGVAPGQAPAFWAELVAEPVRRQEWLDIFERDGAWGYWLWLQFKLLDHLESQKSDAAEPQLVDLETKYSASWSEPQRVLWWQTKAWFYQKHRKFEHSNQALERCLALEHRLESDPLIKADHYYQQGANDWYLAKYNPAMGRFQQCFQLQKTALEGHVRLSNTLNSLGMIAARIDRLDDAVQHLNAALDIQKTWGVDSTLMAKTLNNLGIVFAKQGQLTASEASFRKSLAIRKKTGSETSKIATLLNNLGLNAVVREDWQSAVAYFRESLSHKTSHDVSPANLASGHLNLGKSLFALGETEQAMASFRTAIDILQTHLPDSLDESQGHLFLGKAYIEQGENEKALASLDAAIGMIEKNHPFGLVMAQAKQDRARALLGLGEIEQATLEANEAHRVFDAIAPDGRKAGESHLLLGDLAAASGDAQAAVEAWQLGLAKLEAQFQFLGGSFQTGAHFLAAFSPYYHRAIGAMLKRGETSEAFLLSEHYHSLAYLLDRARRVAWKKLPEKEKLLHQLRQLDHQIEENHQASMNLQSGSEERVRLLNQIHALRETRTQLKQSWLARTQPDLPVGHVAIAKALEPGTVLVSFITSAAETSAFCLNAEGRLDAFHIPISRQELEVMVKDFRRFISRPTSAGTTLFQSEAQALFQALFEPILPAISDDDHLAIIADGPLYQLPFAALMTQENHAEPSYLIDRWSFSLLPSGTFLHYQQDRQTDAELELLLVGAPQQFADSNASLADKGDFGQGLSMFHAMAPTRSSATFPHELVPQTVYASQDADQAAPSDAKEYEGEAVRDQFNPLLFSPLELDAIAKCFPKDQYMAFSGDRATKANIEPYLGLAKVLHFSCHSQLNDQAPFLSSLILAQDAMDAEPDRLYAWEILDKGPFNANLAVLSACETAMGPEAGGHGLLSLTQAFHQAGVPSVVASLWRVSDLSTAILMTHFYQNLTEGATISTALRKAQLSLLNHTQAGQSKLAHPYWWAGFQLYGRPN